jgi:hypothetical protein
LESNEEKAKEFKLMENYSQKDESFLKVIELEKEWPSGRGLF